MMVRWLAAVLALFTFSALGCGSQGTASLAASPTPTCTDADAVARVRPSVVQVYAEGYATSAIGTGVVVGPNGLVLTAAHVVRGLSRVSILPDKLAMLPNKDSATFRGVVVAKRDDIDLALIVAGSAAGLPALSMADDPALKQGDRLLALGYPAGTERGAASLVGGLFTGLFEKGTVTYIGTDAPVTHGNSGGPLFTQCGTVVGIVSFGVKGSATDNYAVASMHARTLIAEHASRASVSATSMPPPVPPVVRETPRSTPPPTVRVAPPTAAPIRSTATPPAVAVSRTTPDPFEFCALAGTADWPVEEYRGAVRYTGEPYPFAGRVFRCWSGKVLTYETGASGGVCMKLDRSNTPDQYLRDWCRANPNTTNLPFAVIGHGPRLYTWACAGGVPIITGRRSTSDIDALDYIIGVWVEVTRATAYQPVNDHGILPGC